MQDRCNSIANAQGAVSIRKTVLLGMVIPMLKIRRPTGRLIFNMGIPIPGKTVFYIETGPWICIVLALTHWLHYNDVIMGMLASQITSLTIVYSIDYSGADQRKHQSSVSLAFVWGIHQGPVNSPHKWPVTRKMFPFDDVIMCTSFWACLMPCYQSLTCSSIRIILARALVKALSRTSICERCSVSVDRWAATSMSSRSFPPVTSLSETNQYNSQSLPKNNVKMIKINSKYHNIIRNVVNHSNQFSLQWHHISSMES